MTKECDATLLFETHHINYQKASKCLESLPCKNITDPVEQMQEMYDFREYEDFRANVFELFPTRKSRKMDNWNQKIS